MSRRVTMFVAVVALLVLIASLAACGGDPYAGTWTSSSGVKLVIAKANDGWWSIDTGTKFMPQVIYVAEINGELQTENGRNTFKRSGDKLEVTLAPGVPAATEFFTKQ
jgi:hypothetical protein